MSSANSVINPNQQVILAMPSGDPAMSDPNDHPATELSKLLLSSLKQNFGTSTRNARCSSLIFSKAGLIYNEIGKIITAIESGATFDWNAFLKYTAAVEPLERLLLDFFSIESTTNHLPPNSSTTLAVRFISKWATDKAQVGATLKGLQKDSFKVLSDTITSTLSSDEIKFRNEDDRRTLGELCKKLDAFPKFNERALHRTEKPITRVIEQAKLIRDAFDSPVMLYDPKLAILAIKSVMASYTLYAVLDNRSTPVEWQKHLSTYEIWNEAKTLLSEVASYLKEGDKHVLPSKLEAAYNTFEAHLTSVGNAGSELLKVARLAGKVKRPFYGRSVVVVMMCHALYVRANTNGQEKVDFKLLAEVFIEAIHALTMASTSPIDLESFRTSQPIFKDLVDVFSSTTKKANECFTEYKIGWNEYEAMYNIAVKTDHAHLEEMRKKLNLANVETDYVLVDNDYAAK